jgi:hypothetical protein
MRQGRLASLSSDFVVGCLVLITAGLMTVGHVGVAVADGCPEEPPLQNYTGGGSVVCPCFVDGEQAGAVLDAPSDHYPIEILRVGIGWGSQYGGTPQSLEEAIHIYEAGLPAPGTPVFSLPGPVMTDGAINEFDLEPLPGEIIIDSGPFTVTLEFANSNAGDPFAPSMVHDGNGCQSGKNVVFAIPGGWYDACLLGVTGDWVVHVIYRQVNCGAGMEEEIVASGHAAVLMMPQPNPFTHETHLGFALTKEEHVELSLYDVGGALIAALVDEVFSPGIHGTVWSGRAADGNPVASGIYFVRMKTGAAVSTRRVILTR